MRIGVEARICPVLVALVLLCLGAAHGQKKKAAGQPPGFGWDLLVLDGAPEAGAWTDSLGVGDIDGDGQQEVVVGGETALVWYRPATLERGVIDTGTYSVGVALADVDGDGAQEVIAGKRIDPEAKVEEYRISWFRRGKGTDRRWTEHVIDPLTAGHPHDLLFADLDGDGRSELIATAIYSPTPGLFLYKRPADPRQPWLKHMVQSGLAAEGTAAGDLNRDGRPDLVSGPYWFESPAGGISSGPWKRRQIAGFREMCRAGVADINGDGRPDVVLVESEYPDGRMSWFENRLASDPRRPWVEHPLEAPLNFAHSLRVWRDGASGPVHAFVAEMAKGGWNAPYNWDARLIQWDFARGGAATRQLIYRGAGTHEATMADLDGDGVLEAVGKEEATPKVQVWKRRGASGPAFRFEHRMLDREKPYTSTDILAADIDGDGRHDVVTGSWWYRSPEWERRSIPGVNQVVSAYDLDRDGRPELIATKRKAGQKDGYGALTSDFCWLKAIDPLNGKWAEYPIGAGSGDWPHGILVAPLLPGGRAALVAGYHNADESHPPEIFEVPADPRTSPWSKRVLAPIRYGEEMAASDLDGDGKLDIVAGPHWLENLGDGSFKSHRLADGFEKAARVRVVDVNGDGKQDVVLVEEDLSYKTRESFFARVAWLENSGDPRRSRFGVRVVDKVRSPHSLDAADLDGDGQAELIVGEHDPFKPYRSRSRLYVYSKADRQGTAWYRHVVDDRFEHHDGTRIIPLAPGRLGIVSHGWADSKYVHLWEPE